MSTGVTVQGDPGGETSENERVVARRQNRLRPMTDLEDGRAPAPRSDAIGPTSRAVLQHTLLLPDHERARSIGDMFNDPKTQTFAQLLIDPEESPTRAPSCWVSFGSESCVASPDGLHVMRSFGKWWFPGFTSG